MPTVITNPAEILRRNGGYCTICGLNKAIDRTMCRICLEEEGDDLPDFAMLTPPAVRPGSCRKAAEGERDPVESALLRDIEANGYHARAIEVRHGSGRVKI